VCGLRLPPAELAAHVEAELVAGMADDDDEEEGGGDGVGRAGGHGDHAARDDALLPPRPPAAGHAVFALGGGGGRASTAAAAGATTARATARDPHAVRVPTWAATLTAVASRPGRVDHYSDARATVVEGDALGIDGVAGAAAGWEVAGASGLGAAGLNGEQV
jgi:hypothetical protein